MPLTASGLAGFVTTALSQGSTDTEDVLALQNWLVKNGLLTQAQLNTGPGVYGPATTAAVASLQQQLGIDAGTSAGDYGTLTIATIQAEIDVLTPSVTPSPDQIGSLLIEQFEGYRERAYFDVNAYRVGYGDDLYAVSNGSGGWTYDLEVTASTTTTVSAAVAELQHRIDTNPNGGIPGIERDIGANKFLSLSPWQQGVLEDLVWNDGSLENTALTSVLADLKSNSSDEVISNDIRALSNSQPSRPVDDANLFSWTPPASAASSNPLTITAASISPQSGDYGPGQSFAIGLVMSEAVTVSGAPTLTLNDGGLASYLETSGNTLVFAYTSAPGQTASALAVTGVNLQGGTIRDSSGNNANLALPATASFTGLQIDASPPSILAPSLLSVDQGQPIDWNAITITDPQSSNTGSTVSVTLEDANGLLSADDDVVGGGGTITGSETPVLTVSGSVDQVDADLDTLTVTDSAPIPDAITITANDAATGPATPATVGVTVNSSQAAGHVISGLITNTVTLSNSSTQNPLTVSSTGTVSVSNAAALLGTAGVPWTVNNFGTVTTTDAYNSVWAIDLTAGGTVLNGASSGTYGIIRGAGIGVIISGGTGTVGNLGTIIGVGQEGIDLLNGGNVTNGQNGSSGGVIIGYGEGISTDQQSTNTVTNFGTIETTGSQGGAGVILWAGGIVDNFGLVQVANGQGIGVNNGPGTLVNAGTIKTLGTLGNGVDLNRGGSLLNEAGATVFAQGTNASGVYLSGQTATLTNFGTISAPNAKYGALATRAGGIIANGAAGATGALIEGGNAGIYLNTGGFAYDDITLTNFGTIEGVSGLKVSEGNIASDTIINVGTIVGTGGTAIALGNGNNRLVIHPGAVFDGTVDGGAGANTIELAAGAYQGGLYGLGSSFTNFSSLLVDAGSVWSLSSGASDPLAVTNDGIISVTDTLLSVGSVVADSEQSGIVELSDSANLEIQSTVGTAQTIFFVDGTDSLTLDAANSFSGSLVGFEAGDIINIAGVTASSATYSDGVLTVLNGNTTVARLGLTTPQALPVFDATPENGNTVLSVITLPTVASIASSVSGGNDLNAGKAVVFTVNMNTNAEVNTAGGVPTLVLNDDRVATYTGGSGTSALTFGYTVQAGDNIGDLQVTGLSIPSGSAITDSAGNAANLANATDDTGIQIDTTAPAVTEALVDDTGSSATDQITSDPAVTGSGDPNATVTITEGSITLGTTTANGSGIWTFTPTGFSDGAYTIAGSETDGAGNTGTASLSFTLKTSAPAPSALALAAASDSGVKGDDITNDATPVITGLGEAGDTITLFDGSTVVGNATVASNASWSITTAALANGSHSLAATETDIAGNLSVTSAPLSLLIDSIPPAVAITSLGGATNSSAQTITGTVNIADAGTIVTVLDGTTSLGTAAVAGNGTWSAGVTLDGNGLHTITAEDTDVAGNTGVSTAVDYELDTTPPTTTAVNLTVAGNSAATSIGIAAPTDPNYDASALAVTLTELPTDGSVLLSDGAAPTPVHQGEILTVAQLVSLEFQPGLDAFGETGTLTYTVADPAGNSATGTASLVIENQSSPPPPPTVNVQNITVAENTPVAASSMIASVSDPSGDNITAYEFIDEGGGSGYFSVNGVAQPDNQRIEVLTNNLSDIEYVGGTTPGTDTLEVGVYDYTTNSYSSYSPLTATTTAPPSATSPWTFAASQGTPVNAFVTPDGSNLAAPVDGDFNLEEVTAPSVTNYALPTGYQGVALVSDDAVTLLHGNYGVADSNSDGGDTIYGGDGDDTINALVGDDTIGAGSGNATVFAGLGDVIDDPSGNVYFTQSGGANPTIFAISGGALMYAGADDTLVGGGGTATVVGAPGDVFALGGGDDTVNVIPTGESLTFGSGSAIVFGGPGDTIGDGAGTVVDFTSGSNAIVLAGSGNSVLLYSGPGDTIVGGNAASTVIGSTNDEIVLGTGADTVNAFPANEVVEFGSGENETVFGGAGDTIQAAGGAALVTFEAGSQGVVFAETAGQNQLYSGPDDTLAIGPGTMNIIGAAGNALVLGTGTDTVNALPPNETVMFGSGNATVFGGDGDTIGDAAGTVVTFTGGNSAIAVEGTSGAITAYNGTGDTIAAGNAAAAIVGADNSAIVLGSAADTVTGSNGEIITTGAGSASIDFNTGVSHTKAEFLAPGTGADTSANDTVVNFSQAAGDAILETGTAETNSIASAQSSGGNTTITLSDGSTVTLIGVTTINSSFFS